MAVKTKLGQAIADAKSRMPFFRYVHYDGRGIRQVNCKLCGTPIVVRGQDGKLRPTAAYRETTFECDDGTLHSSPLCTCASSATEEQLRDAYYADMAELTREDNTASAALLTAYAERKPTDILIDNGRRPSSDGRTQLAKSSISGKTVRASKETLT